MNKRFIQLVYVFIILCGREGLSSAQNLSIQLQDKVEFPPYLESNLGFIPLDMKFENDSIFYINTYYAGLYKFRLTKNRLIVIDSFFIEASHLNLFERSLQRPYQIKRKKYKYFIYSNLNKLSMPFQYAFSSSKIHIIESGIAVIFTLYFGESIKTNINDTLNADSVQLKKETKVSMHSFLAVLDTSLKIQSIYPIDRDSFYAMPGNDRISSSLENEFFRNPKEIYSGLIYAPQEVSERSPAAIKWKIENGIVWPEKILRSITLSANTVRKNQNENWPGFSANVHFLESSGTLYAFQDNQVFKEYSKDSFILDDLIKTRDSSTLSSVKLFSTDCFLINYKSKKASMGQASISYSSYFYYPEKKLQVTINDSSSFEGNYLNIKGTNAFTISTNNGSFFLNRYRLSTGTK